MVAVEAIAESAGKEREKMLAVWCWDAHILLPEETGLSAGSGNSAGHHAEVAFRNIQVSPRLGDEQQEAGWCLLGEGAISQQGRLLSRQGMVAAFCPACRKARPSISGKKKKGSEDL